MEALKLQAKTGSAYEFQSQYYKPLCPVKWSYLFGTDEPGQNVQPEYIVRETHIGQQPSTMTGTEIIATAQVIVLHYSKIGWPISSLQALCILHDYCLDSSIYSDGDTKESHVLLSTF